MHCFIDSSTPKLIMMSTSINMHATYPVPRHDLGAQTLKKNTYLVLNYLSTKYLQ